MANDNKGGLDKLLSGLHDSWMQNPYTAQLLKDISQGTLSDDAILEKVLTWTREHPDLAQNMQDQLDQLIACYQPEETGITRTNTVQPPRTSLLEIRDGKSPRLNPLYEAALTERLQFDGDIPEMRSGPLPPGSTPALPIATDARNPVALGEMLQRVSREVEQEVRDAQKKLAAKQQDLLEGPDLAIVPAGTNEVQALQKKVDGIMALQRDPQYDPEKYRRGRLPEPVVVSRPEGSALATLGDSEKKEAAWMVLSTTQGRRTSLSVIAKLILERLQTAGFTVESARYDPSAKVDILAYEKWTMNLAGPNATQPGFAVIDVAAGYLASQLIKQLGYTERGLLLQLTPINAIDARMAGWAARCVAKEDN